VIRPATREDSQAVANIAVESGLFSPHDVGIVTAMMTAYFTANSDEGHLCLIDEDDETQAVAYVEPAPAADRTWYLTMIAARLRRQGEDCGAALIQHVEDHLRARDQRLLLVQTSGLAAFERTRAFYDGCCYEREARVRDYYEPGDDMVLFRKAL